MALSDILQTQLTAIQAAIATAIANPAPNWSVGQVKFNQTEYLEFLYEQQGKILEQLRKIPSEVITTAQNAMDTFGRDGTEFTDEV